MRRRFSFKGEFKELSSLFFAILFVVFSNYFFLLVEKVFLARLSVQAMEAAVASAYLCQIFQGSCVALAMMAQVYVGRACGAGLEKSVGPGLWQFFWFSVMSMVITLPTGLLYGGFYFKGMATQAIATPYYTFLMGMNFLYPLGAALSCFYLGQGKPRLILSATLLSQGVKTLLAYLLIFGWKGFIPSLGILGGAVSTLIAQTLFCGVLLCMFLSKKNALTYNTRAWRFQPKLFWECIYPGLLRACNRVLNFTSWAAIVHMIAARGSDYSLMLSIGGALFLCLPLFADALCQAQVTVVSTLLGQKNYLSLKKTFYSGSAVAALIALFTAIPLLCFPDHTFSYLFPSIDLSPETIHRLFFGVWLSFLFMTLGFLFISDILAFKDMQFSFLMGLLSWINGYLFIWFALNHLSLKADQFWLALSLMHGTTALAYLWRSLKLRSQPIHRPQVASSVPFLHFEER